MKFVVFSVLALSPLALMGLDRVGTFVEVNGTLSPAPLFIQRIHTEQNEQGQTVRDATIEDSEGKIILTEHAVSSGFHILSQKVDQNQIHEGYELEVKDKEVTFRTFKLEGEQRSLISEKKHSVGENFITGPSAEEFMRDRFVKAEKGSVAQAEFGVFEIEKAVNFDFIHQGSIHDGADLKVKMRPSSFWLSLLVDPIQMEVDAKNFLIKKYKGRTPVRILDHGHLTPVDAVIEYKDKTADKTPGK